MSQPTAQSTVEAVVYATISRRFQAALIDSVVTLSATAITLVLISKIEFISGAARLIVILSPALLLEPLLLSLWGSTVGYYMYNQEVVKKSTWRHLYIHEAFGRYIIKLALGALSLIFMLMTQKHQALHDLFVDSIVKIRDTSKPYVGYSTHSLEATGFTYPPAWRKILVIMLYMFLFTVFVGSFQIAFVSEECADDLSSIACTPEEKVIERVIGAVIMLGLAFILVVGWRGFLWGARRKRV